MDELDRPTDCEGLTRSRSPVQQVEMGNRPPVAMDESQEYDEVDRPGSNVTEPPTPMRQESEMDVVDRPHVVIPPVQQGNEDDNNEILPTIAVVPDKHKEPTTPVELDNEEILPTILDSPHDVDKAVLEEMPPPSPGSDATDGPPSQTDGTPSQTDGPFSTSFFKPTQQKLLVQHRSERTSKEGIVTKHTTFHPKPLEKTNKIPNYAENIYSDSYYKMDCFPRGKLTLINVKFFQRSSGMADYPREGTNRDAEGLTNLFLDLGFVVDRFDNPSKKEILAIVKAAANEDYSGKSCSACAMLSHGEEGIIYGTDDFVKIKDVAKMFRSRGLAGKPKFFLFQACQGSEYMDPLDAVDGPGRRMTEEEMALTLPSEADFMYAYSTVPGYYSWRNSRRGSWFMEALVQVFRENAHKMDVMRMLVKVNDIISFRKSRTDDYKTDNKRQIASLVTQMRKDFFLFPPYGPLPKPQ